MYKNKKVVHSFVEGKKETAYLVVASFEKLMESHRNLPTKDISICLLPSELIQYIILSLALPDIIRLKSVNKSIFSIIADRDFVRDYNIQSRSATWLFLYKKRWRREAVLYGFTDCSNRWFNILIADMLKQVVPPGEDVYFLTASGNIFLFALNNSQEVISVNIMTRMVKKIPPSPLGPRGTSSWRRSGMKLLSCPCCSDHFRFLFAELDDASYPTLFEYDSKVEKWQFTRAREVNQDLRGDFIFLSASNGRNGSVIIAVRPQSNNTAPIVVRPTFIIREDQLAVGFSWGNAIDLLHVYGDGNMMIIRSDKIDAMNKTVRKIKGIELWGLSTSGRYWEFVSKAPTGLIEKISKPYGAMMGCMQKREGITRAIMMTNLEGIWDTIWLSYDNKENHWAWLPLPDCKMKGSNLAGVTFSSGLVLS